jgi:hypothetical protein
MDIVLPDDWPSGALDQASTGKLAVRPAARPEPPATATLGSIAACEALRLAELRLQATETRIDAGLHLGRYGEVICEMRQLTGDPPLRERLYALLMLELCRYTRQTEARLIQSSA